jgi:hypothetical protein
VRTLKANIRRILPLIGVLYRPAGGRDIKGGALG